jgi:polyhydroxyalkanoate synthesis regulator phasin
MTELHAEKRYRTPLFRTLRKVVDAVGDVVDDVIDRGTDIERDARRLVDDALRDREDERGAKKKSAERAEPAE